MASLERERAELAHARRVDRWLGEIHAVRDATCTFLAEEIHAVCGENGAGKTTLLKLVAGMLAPDAGEVLVGGTRLEPHTPGEAIRRGVAMVLQHFALIPVFTALDNILLGAEPTGPLGVIDRDAARARALAIGEELGIELPLDERVEALGIGDRQRVEIARALFRDARLLILDEPTAVLTKPEAAALYRTLRRLAEAGKGVVVVTHKMDEVEAHADVVTVMRRGEIVLTARLDRRGGTRAEVERVAAAIMGASPRAPADAAEVPPSGPAEGEPALVMRDVTVGRGLLGASLVVRSGEIVGVAGVEGNGQKELVAVLAGDVGPDEGSLTGGPFAIVREDRQSDGLVLDASLRENLLLGELGRFTRWGLLDLAAVEREARARVARAGAPPDLDRAARTLSGGNQQKLVVARALARDARVVVAAQPTRGVDLAASEDIHAALVRAARRGAGVLLVSADLDELRRLASRIVVLARGRIVAELPSTATDDELGRAMLGIAAEGAAPAGVATTENGARAIVRSG